VGAEDREGYRKHAAELAELAPDVIFAATSGVVAAAQQASPKVPVVLRLSMSRLDDLLPWNCNQLRAAA
jgi:hypothetical protein